MFWLWFGDWGREYPFVLSCCAPTPIDEGITEANRRTVHIVYSVNWRGRAIQIRYSTKQSYFTWKRPESDDNEPSSEELMDVYPGWTSDIPLPLQKMHSCDYNSVWLVNIHKADWQSSTSKDSNGIFVWKDSTFHSFCFTVLSVWNAFIFSMDLIHFFHHFFLLFISYWWTIVSL